MTIKKWFVTMDVIVNSSARKIKKRCGDTLFIYLVCDRILLLGYFYN